LLLGWVQGGESIVVPAHWPLEIANGILMARRRGRVTDFQVREFIEDLAALPIEVQPASAPAAWPEILRLAQKHRLTAYDAAYLELAQRTGLPLATLDGDLRKAALDAGAELMEAQE
jgi:predicted nucleic acid-binding protein